MIENLEKLLKQHVLKQLAKFRKITEPFFHPKPKPTIADYVSGGEKNLYPKTVAECIDDDLKYQKATIKALEKFKKTKPWKGTKKEQMEKYIKLNLELSEIYKIKTPLIFFYKKIPNGCCYIPDANLIVMEENNHGKYSTIAFLHEFGHALGKNEKYTCRWSINLFKRVFPGAYKKLKPVGHLLYKED